ARAPCGYSPLLLCLRAFHSPFGGRFIPPRRQLVEVTIRLRGASSLRGRDPRVVGVFGVADLACDRRSGSSWLFCTAQRRPVGSLWPRPDLAVRCLLEPPGIRLHVFSDDRLSLRHPICSYCRFGLRIDKDVIEAPGVNASALTAQMQALRPLQRWVD